MIRDMLRKQLWCSEPLLMASNRKRTPLAAPPQPSSEFSLQTECFAHILMELFNRVNTKVL